MNAGSLARQYAALACITHALVITLSLLPSLRAIPLTAGDAISYLLPAQNIVERSTFSRESSAPYLWEPYRTPGYPLCLAGSIKLFGDYQWALYLAALSAGCAAWCAIKCVALFSGGRVSLHTAGLIISFLPNSLGLSAQILTDSIAGHLTLVWVYLLVSGCRTGSLKTLGLSSVVLMLLQSFKPTFNLAGVLIALVVFLYVARRRKIAIAVVLIALSLPLQMYFSNRNVEAHEVKSASLLGVETVREYLQVRHLQEMTGEEYAALTNKIRKEDELDAQKLSTPSSFYGRLYLVKSERVNAFLGEHPLAAMRLMFTEMVQQFAAPQEFFPQVFIGDLPQWGRVLGSLLTLALWGCAFLGAYTCWQRGQWQAAVLLGGVLLFFLVTGSVSHLVGGRLRFPADVAAIPFAGIGVESVLGSRFMKGLFRA